jgi:branched-chain amino acid transport system substrate-binding protein
MYGDALIEAIGEPLNGSFGAVPGTDSEGAAKFQEMATAAGFDGTSAFSPESYDAAALILMSMAAANSTSSKDWTTKVMDLANAPGEPILPGELGKALELIAAGTDIDYIGATARGTGGTLANPLATTANTRSPKVRSPRSGSVDPSLLLT